MDTIITKRLQATDTRGLRIKATHTNGKSKTIGYPYDQYEASAHRIAAEALADQLHLRYDRMVAGQLHNGDFVFILEDV